MIRTPFRYLLANEIKEGEVCGVCVTHTEGEVHTGGIYGRMLLNWCERSRMGGNG